MMEQLKNGLQEGLLWFQKERGLRLAREGKGWVKETLQKPVHTLWSLLPAPLSLPLTGAFTFCHSPELPDPSFAAQFLQTRALLLDWTCCLASLSVLSLLSSLAVMPMTLPWEFWEFSNNNCTWHPLVGSFSSPKRLLKTHLPGPSLTPPLRLTNVDLRNWKGFSCYNQVICTSNWLSPSCFPAKTYVKGDQRLQRDLHLNWPKCNCATCSWVMRVWGLVCVGLPDGGTVIAQWKIWAAGCQTN